MAKEGLVGKLAVILHADVAGSTELVRQDKELAHERIQDGFKRFADTIEKYRWFQVELLIRLTESCVHLKLKSTLLHRFDLESLPVLTPHL